MENIVEIIDANNKKVELTIDDVQEIYKHLTALYYRSSTNGLVEIDSYDRSIFKKLLKL